ncbi:MAG: hypothetical protein AB8C95_12045 [Phycisphaeraceae bacterium]
MIRFSIVLVVLGGILTFFGYNENKLASSAQAEPQTMTVAELAANGIGDNANISLTDFWLLDSQSVVEYPEDDESKYNKIWAPVIPAGDPFIEEYMNSDPNQAPPSYTGSVAVILYSKDINNDDEFYDTITEGAVQGLIINEIDQISGEELQLLQQGVPGINADTVLVLEHNRQPKSTGITLLMMVGGVVLILAGPALFFLGRGK